MLIAYWITAGIAALMFAAAAFMKTTRPRPALAEAGMAYVEDFSDSQIKLIGALEGVGALGLILPLALGIVPILSPIAAVGLTLVMVGAVVVHIRRKEGFTPSLVLLVLSGVSAVLGFLVIS